MFFKIVANIYKVFQYIYKKKCVYLSIPAQFRSVFKGQLYLSSPGQRFNLLEGTIYLFKAIKWYIMSTMRGKYVWFYHKI